jgi:hypothetical protein
MQRWQLDTGEKIQFFVQHITQMMQSGHPATVEFIKPEPGQRTPTQNNCLHQWLGQVAEILNTAGLDQRAVLKVDAEIPWSQHSTKSQLWVPVQKALTGHESTTECSTTDYPAICETITRHLGQKFGVVLPPWPTRFNNGGQIDG